MNDRFKFRGITKGKVNKFVYGSLLWYAGEPQIWDKDGKNYIVQPQTVGQSTGLKDKNGTLIYEGDIVRVNNKVIAIIEFYRGIFGCRFDLKYKNFERFLGVGAYDNDEIEVIGNIYKNKELLDERN